MHYQKLGYNIYLYHLRNINKAYPKEYENAEKIAAELGLVLYIEEITLSGNHIYTEHPMKNMMIANAALHFGIRNNIGIKIAFGNYYTAQLKDNEFDDEMEFKIVGATEANSLKGKISNESPLGKALIGAKKGDVVTVEAPAGIIEYTILDIYKPE